MFKSLPSALVPYNPIVALVQQPTRREVAQRRIASASQPIHTPGITLLPATTQPSTPRPTRTIAYSHVGLGEISFQTFDRMTVAVTRVTDQMLRYARGEINESSWTRAITEFMREGKRINKSNPIYEAPDTPDTEFRNTPLWTSPEYRTPGEHERAQRLHDLMLFWLNIDVNATTGCIVIGEYRYTINTTLPVDRLCIERLHPNGRQYITPQDRADNAEEARFIIEKLNAQWQHEKEILDSRITVARIEDVQPAIDRRVAERQAARNSNPFTPSAPLFALGG